MCIITHPNLKLVVLLDVRVKSFIHTSKHVILLI